MYTVYEFGVKKIWFERWEIMGHPTVRANMTCLLHRRSLLVEGATRAIDASTRGYRRRRGENSMCSGWAVYVTMGWHIGGPFYSIKEKLYSEYFFSL